MKWISLTFQANVFIWVQGISSLLLRGEAVMPLWIMHLLISHMTYVAINVTKKATFQNITRFLNITLDRDHKCNTHTNTCTRTSTSHIPLVLAVPENQANPETKKHDFISSSSYLAPKKQAPDMLSYIQSAVTHTHTHTKAFAVVSITWWEQYSTCYYRTHWM